MSMGTVEMERRILELERDRDLVEAQVCTKCGDDHERQGQRYCLSCHAAYMREWRKTHPLTDAQKLRANARSMANEYRKRGHLVPEPCETCGSEAVEMHHDDYSRPLDVRWMCRGCHLEFHRDVSRANTGDDR